MGQVLTYIKGDIMKKTTMEEINEIHQTVRPSDTLFWMNMKVKTDYFQPNGVITFKDAAGRTLGEIINAR